MSEHKVIITAYPHDFGLSCPCGWSKTVLLRSPERIAAGYPGVLEIASGHDGHDHSNDLTVGP